MRSASVKAPLAVYSMRDVERPEPTSTVKEKRHVVCEGVPVGGAHEGRVKGPFATEHGEAPAAYAEVANATAPVAIFLNLSAIFIFRSPDTTIQNSFLHSDKG